MEQTGKSELGIITGNRLAIGQPPDYQATGQSGHTRLTHLHRVSSGLEVTLILNGGKQIFNFFSQTQENGMKTRDLKMSNKQVYKPDRSFLHCISRWWFAVVPVPASQTLTAHSPHHHTKKPLLLHPQSEKSLTNTFSHNHNDTQRGTDGFMIALYPIGEPCT